MSYSLTINFIPPTGNGYQFVTEYRVKYWPTSSPTNVSTVFTTAFPLVLTDLNSTSYSGTIEAKCGSTYGTARSFGPVVISGGGSGGGGTTPACPYRVVLYEEPSVTYDIGASSNTTLCVKPGYQIKLTTEGGALVTTSTALTVAIDYTVETGDCANPTNVQTFSTTLTIPAGSSISGSYIQVSQPNQRISNVSFRSGNQTTLVNDTLTCNLTYTGGGTALPVKNYYLTGEEVTSGQYKSVRWYLSDAAGGMIITQNFPPMNMLLGYTITGAGINGDNSNITSTINVTGLDLMSGESNTGQGTTAYNWYNVRNFKIQFSPPGQNQYDWENPIDVINENGGSVNNPATYVYNGTIYKIIVYIHYSLASSGY